jgi:hypothetical protein
MLCDIYYATEEQDKYGKIKKIWNYDRSEPCTFYSLSDKSNSDNFVYDISQFYKLETMLFGRVRTDARKGSDGFYHPVSHILITNLRSGSPCNEGESAFYIETNNVWEAKPTIFELKMIQPFVGPFNSVEYYKIQLERSDSQELLN